jgi:hypothetical protein
MEVTQFPYSFKFSVASLLLMVIFISLLFVNVLTANSFVGWAVFSVFALAFLLMFVLVVVKRLIPALKGDIALQLDEDGISDYIRNISINWIDIEEISLVRGRSASSVRLGLKFVSDYGNLIIIPLRWVKGNDDDIYDTITAYYQYYPEGETDN